MDDASPPPRLPALPAIEPGSVWLVGAGPGDPGLLTLHAANALSVADCVVYDALVAPEILALARPGAALEYAGKRGGKPSAHQPDICGRLIRLARQGLRVLRLKGGDPSSSAAAARRRSRSPQPASPSASCRESPRPPAAWLRPASP